MARGFLDGGADVIISGIDTTEAITVAKQYMDEGDASFGVPYGNVNGCSEGPDACLGAAYYNWGPAYLDVVNRVGGRQLVAGMALAGAEVGRDQ